MGRVAGVKRPALAQMLPGWPTPTLLLDVGANADCKPEYLAQFGIMGAAYLTGAYAVEALGWAKAKGLLNMEERMLLPGERVRRRRVADMVMQFCENVIE